MRKEIIDFFEDNKDRISFIKNCNKYLSSWYQESSNYQDLTNDVSIRKIANAINLDYSELNELENCLDALASTPLVRYDEEYNWYSLVKNELTFFQNTSLIDEFKSFQANKNRKIIRTKTEQDSNILRNYALIITMFISLSLLLLKIFG